MAKPAIAPMEAPEEFQYALGHVISKDGTRIGFRRYGAGPALVLVQGAIGTTADYHDLARALSRDFAVFVPERRGRPLSPCAYSPDYLVENEVEDLRALLTHAGARFLFGLSSGGAIALEAARILPGIDKLAVFEAPLYVPPRSMRFDLVDQFERELNAGKVTAAMVTAFFISGFVPRPVRLIPRPVLDRIAAVAIRWNGCTRADGRSSLRELVPTMCFDFGVVSRLQGRLERFAAVESDVLLLSCRKSPAYLREATAALARTLPNARQVEFSNMTHSGPWNADRGGHPATVAATLRDFLLPTGEARP